MKRLFVANLNYSVTDEMLFDFFSAAGEVIYAKVIKDRETQKSRGFGFVEYSNEAFAEDAIKKFNGVAFEKRNIVVRVAKPM